MGHAPERIWLQWHGDADPEIEDGEVSEGDVSWCRDKIFTHDIEYIRADLADAALKAREAAMKAACIAKAHEYSVFHREESEYQLRAGRRESAAEHGIKSTFANELATALESATAQQKGSE